jgi:hypothetical protein
MQTSKAMKYLSGLSILCYLLFPAGGKAQSWTDLYPTLGESPKLGTEVQREFERAKHLLETRAFDDLSAAERELAGRWETFAGIYDIVGDGCSWYCAGGPDTVTASSALAPQGKNTYEGYHAHDLSLRYAWVEGAAGQGEGEYLEYRFHPESPRITHIKVYNGYVKSEKAWRANSRVKVLRLHVNGKPLARMHLTDTRAEQVFALPEPLGRLGNRQDLRLRFEIESVYPGERYEDTAIIEIFFDGLDVHCLAEGTPIRLADGREKPIEQLEPGDSVWHLASLRSWSGPAAVSEVRAFTHSNCLILTFADGRTLTATAAHPFLLADGRWVSADPGRSRIYGYPVQRAYREGDTFAGRNGEGAPTAHRLVRIAPALQHRTTLTLRLRQDEGGIILANGLLNGMGHQQAPD